MLVNLRRTGNTLGEFLRERRVERGYTQVRLSQESGISKEMISTLECGRTPRGSDKTLSELSRVLGCSFEGCVKSPVKPRTYRKRVVKGLPTLLLRESRYRNVSLLALAQTLGFKSEDEMRQKAFCVTKYQLTFQQAIAVSKLLHMRVDDFRAYVRARERHCEVNDPGALHSVLRAKRQSMGITTYQMAKLIGVSQQAVTHTERGRYVPSEKYLAGYATAYDIPYERIVALAEERRQPKGGAGHRIKRRL